jgi:outer membrane receptor protein involved in Fe transport
MEQRPARALLLAHILAAFAVGMPAAGMAAEGAAEADASATAAAPADSGSSFGQLQSITVTATKRTEDIKDIPTSVSAIDADQLLEHHVGNYDDITRTIPSVSFQAGTGPGLDNIEMRGVSSTSGSATVGIYIDEVSVTVKNTYDGAVEPKLFDLERVEVLRGPQGTLYGASSMGGTIRFITKQADVNEFGGSAATDLSYTKHGTLSNDTNAVINVPIVQGSFALRLGADVSYESGYVDHYAPTPTGAGPGNTSLSMYTNDSTGVLQQKGVNDVRTEVLRFSGKYSGPDDLSIVPAFFLQRTTQGDSGVFFPAIGQYEQDKRVGEPAKDIVTVPSLTVNKGFGFADLTSVTSYFRRDFHRTTDGTYYNSNVFANYFVLPTYPGGTAAQNAYTANVIGFLSSPVFYDTTTDQFSEEMRLASRDAKVAGVPITWVGGLYFSNMRQAHTDDEFMPGLQADFLANYGVDINQSPLGNAFLPGVSYANDLIYLAHNNLRERQIAPFGEFGIDITPQLKGSLGLRYVAAKTSYGFTSGGFYAYGLPNPYSNEASFHATTPKASLDYAVTPNSNVYASIAKGCRLGGPTGPDPANTPGGSCDQDYANLGIPGAPLKYDSDSLWSYELGTKGRYLDNRLSVNAAIYAINWKNIQQSVNLPICGFTFTTNAGDAKSYGTELEVRYLATQSLSLGLAAGTTHAFITSTLEPGIFTVGEEILNVPDYTATLSADYDRPIGDETNLFVRADFPYTGRSHAYYNSSTVANHISPNYGVLNLNVGVTRKKLSVGLYGKNLANNKKIIQYPSVNTVQEGYTLRPLTVGLTASYQF